RRLAQCRPVASPAVLAGPTFLRPKTSYPVQPLHEVAMHGLNLCLPAAGALLLCLCPLPAVAQEVQVHEHTLKNGMRLLLLPRHDEPTIAGGWVAHVGSANERPGITGISHLFEHMMFKGTPTIGTRDYQKDLQIIAEQERIRDQMRAEERKMRAMYREGEIDDILKPENKTK